MRSGFSWQPLCWQRRSRYVIIRRESKRGRREALMSKKLAFSVVVGVLCAGSAYAHHEFTAEFDPDKPVTLNGTVAKVEWVNPHGWIHINVQRPDGGQDEWAIETGTPNALMRAGVTRQVLKPGTAITIDGYRAKDGSKRANGLSLKLSDGRSLFLASSTQRPA